MKTRDTLIVRGTSAQKSFTLDGFLRTEVFRFSSEFTDLISAGSSTTLMSPFSRLSDRPASFLSMSSNCRPAFSFFKVRWFIPI
jgi:hypothetical protein